jgi:hypothetical protein
VAPVFSRTPTEKTSEPYAVFEFSASGASRTECALDDAAWAPCTSPHIVLSSNAVGQPLALESHRLSVRGMDAAGRAGALAQAQWEVTSVFAAGHPALSRSNAQPTPASLDGWLGIFRINCDFDRAVYDDPVVFPGQAGVAHLHSFYGRKGVDAHTTLQTLFTSGGSTCQGDSLNRSAYWVPTLLAPKYNGDGSQQVVNGQPQWQPVLPKLVPDPTNPNSQAHETFYYSAAVSDLQSIQNFPVGLRIIAGQSGTLPGSAQNTSITRWHCVSWQATDRDVPSRFVADIPECAQPDQLRLDLFFPSCWDGKNLDSSDHQSHMAYPLAAAQAGSNRGQLVCPTSHPVALPRVSYHYAFPVLPGNSNPQTKRATGWRLSSDRYTVTATSKGGLSAHGDWFNGWNPEVMQKIIDRCLKTGLDCHDGNLPAVGSDGWRLNDTSAGVQTHPAIINAGLGAHGVLLSQTGGVSGAFMPMLQQWAAVLPQAWRPHVLLAVSSVCGPGRPTSPAATKTGLSLVDRVASAM